MQMERRKEAMPISNPGQSTLASVEPARVNDRRRGTYTINLLLGPLAAPLGGFFFGGWLYFFVFPPPWGVLFFWLARSMSCHLWVAVRWFLSIFPSTLIWRQIPPPGVIRFLHLEHSVIPATS